MLRTLITRFATVALLASLLVAVGSAPSQARDFKPWGKVTSKDHVLKRGCHDYTYRYKVKPPTNQWAAEIFVVGPKKLGLGSNFLDSAIDKKRGKKKITVCRHSAPYGTYKLKMKVTSQEGRELTRAYVKPTKFRFLRPRR